MKTLTIALGILCLGLLLPACQDSSLYPTHPDKQPDQNGKQGLTIDKVIGKGWDLQSFETIGGAVTPITDGRIYSIAFIDQTSFKGESDCNVINGQYAATANYKISFPDISSTEAFCGDESRDADFVAGLRSAVSYTATATTLQIVYDGGTKALNFAPSTRPGSGVTKLEEVFGREWQLDSMMVSRDGGITFEPYEIPATQLFTLMFTDYSHLSGIANCNQYVGIYKHSADPLGITEISSLGSTKVECGIPGSLADDYLSTLQTTRWYNIQIGYRTTLILYDGSRNVRMKFRERIRAVELDFNNLKEIIGLRYVLTEYGPINGVRTSLLTQSAPLPTIKVMSDAQITGTGFCSPFSSDYEAAADNALTISNWVGEPGTAYGCSKDQMLFDALKSVDSYGMGNDTLELYYGNKSNVLVYVRQ